MSNPKIIAPNSRIVITGGAGLVGQNLVYEMKIQGYENLVVIDKNRHNLEVLANMHPDVKIICNDLAKNGEWENSMAGTKCVVMLQAQITGKTSNPFVRNNIVSTRNVLEMVKHHKVPYLIHVSSSVVNSVADDDYTRTKKNQEDLVVESGIPNCVLRPTLMFGWFDPKHLGWLARFMDKTPVFPIPGHGRYSRQPLYTRDFCRIIIKCLESCPKDLIFDVVGSQRIDYVDMIQTIKKAKQSNTLIIHLPLWFFSLLLRLFSLFTKYPPFTNDQLAALTAGDDFKGVDTEEMFGVKQHTFEEAVYETFNHPVNSHVFLKRTGTDE